MNSILILLKKPTIDFTEMGWLIICYLLSIQAPFYSLTGLILPFLLFIAFSQKIGYFNNILLVIFLLSQIKSWAFFQYWGTKLFIHRFVCVPRLASIFIIFWFFILNLSLSRVFLPELWFIIFWFDIILIAIYFQISFMFKRVLNFIFFHDFFFFLPIGLIRRGIYHKLVFIVVQKFLDICWGSNRGNVCGTFLRI